MLFDELPIPLVFYDNLNKQTRFQENFPYMGSELIVPNDRLIPFQIRKVFIADQAVVYWKIKDLNGVLVAEINSLNKIIKASSATFDVFYYKANDPLTTAAGNLNLPCGEYYSEISINGTIYFSEVFRSVQYESDNTFPYLKLEWNNKSSLGSVFYGDLYTNRLYLDALIGLPKPKIERETEPDGYDNPVIISQRIITPYEVSAGYLPGFLVNALSFMSINDTIILTTKKNVRSGKVVNLTLKLTEEETNTLMGVDLTFEQSEVIFKNACDGFDIPMVPGNDAGDADNFDGIIDDGENYDDNFYDEI